MSLEKIKKWNDFHAILLLCAGAATLYASRLWLLLLAAGLSFAYYLFIHRSLLLAHKPVGGYANGVTLFRLLLLMGVAAGYKELSPLIVTIGLLSVVLLDVVDGFLARRMGEESDFGLYFDMETDAFFVLTVAIILYLDALAPAWILIVGFMRYLNVGVYQLFRLKPKKEAKQRFASTIAGMLFIVFALSFILPSGIRYFSLLIVSILVTLSFGRTFLNYLK